MSWTQNARSAAVAADDTVEDARVLLVLELPDDELQLIAMITTASATHSL
jgi:hypothetical protein